MSEQPLFRKAVFVGVLPVLPSPADFYVNRARRGDLPATLTLQQAGVLCVSSDTGEDPDKARQATALLYSLKAGGLLVTIERDGREYVEPSALRAVAARLRTASFWGEGAATWSGAALVELGQFQQVDPLTSSELRRVLVGSGHVTKDGARVEWRTVIENKRIISAARVGIPGAGESGSWDHRKFADAAQQHGYEFHLASGKPRSAEATSHKPHDVIDSMKNSLMGR